MDNRRIVNGSSNNNFNKLVFYYGPMESGKTRDIIKLLHSKKEDGFYPVLMKPLKDSKADNYISSRDGGSAKVDILINDDMDIYMAIANYIRDNIISCIVVDEAQFLNRNQVIQLASIVDILGIDVYCYGLLTDFQNNMFEGSKTLMEWADDKIEIERTCSCGRKRIFNIRIDDEGNRIMEGQQVSIDGEENGVTYFSFCRQCTSILNRETNAKKIEFVKKKSLKP